MQHLQRKITSLSQFSQEHNELCHPEWRAKLEVEGSQNFAGFFTTFLSIQKDGFQVKKLIVGVNYDEKTKEHKCVIEKLVK